MSERNRLKGIFALPLAMWLAIIPMGDWLMPWRPEWVAVALIYLMFNWSGQIGVFVAMAVGLLVDILEGAPVIGQHALGYVAMTYFFVTLAQRFRTFPLVQQSIVVGMLVGINLLVVKLTTQLFSYSGAGLSYWFPALSSMLVWPLISMARFGRRARNW